MKPGVVAPKDPVKKLKGFYIMFDAIIEASERPVGKATQDIYLNGRLIDAASRVGGIEDKNILKLLETAEGFRKLVKRVGVTVTTEETDEVGFVLRFNGKREFGGEGTTLRMNCPCDGAEYVMDLTECTFMEHDDIVGMVAFEFDKPGMMAKASVKCYVDEAYDIPEVQVDEPVDFKSEAYQNMIARSLKHQGNNSRLKKVIEKAKKGEDVTVAYIGGSITQGAGAKPIHTECYAAQSYRGFMAAFGHHNPEKIHFVKAGTGGTSSELGMIRYEMDVLKDGKVQPDLVVIEFAVNDEGDETKGICYESLISKCLQAENKPAVVLLFSVFADDSNLQERLAPIGRHYDLPMVSVLDAVVPQFKLPRGEGGVITKRQYFYDIFHPTNDGHHVMSDCLLHLYHEVDQASCDAEYEMPKAPYKADTFAQVMRIDKKHRMDEVTIEEGGFTETDTDLQCVEMDDHPYMTPQFPYNWKHTPQSGNGSFKMKIECKDLLLVYKDSGAVDAGKALVYVDGKLSREVEPYVIGWTHCNAIIIHLGEKVENHEVEIKMAEGHEDKCFTILGFGYTLQ